MTYSGHVTNSLQVKLVRRKAEEAVYFFQVIKDKNKIITCDSEQHRNADLYQELESEMRQKGFEELRSHSTSFSVWALGTVQWKHLQVTIVLEIPLLFWAKCYWKCSYRLMFLKINK